MTTWQSNLVTPSVRQKKNTKIWIPSRSHNSRHYYCMCLLLRWVKICSVKKVPEAAKWNAAINHFYYFHLRVTCCDISKCLLWKRPIRRWFITAVFFYCRDFNKHCSSTWLCPVWVTSVVITGFKCKHLWWAVIRCRASTHPSVSDQWKSCPCFLCSPKHWNTLPRYSLCGMPHCKRWLLET